METKSKGKKKKGKENTKEPSKTTSKSSLAFSLLFLTLAISGGLYIYYFVDVDDVLGTVSKFDVTCLFNCLKVKSFCAFVNCKKMHEIIQYYHIEQALQNNIL